MRALLAYDGSEGSALAADTIWSIAWPAATTIRVVAVLPSQLQATGPRLGLSDAPPAGFEEEVAAELRSDLARVARRLRAKGRRIEVDVLRGRPADAILEDAATFQADLLVLGTRGHGSVASLVLGSVSAEVVDRSPAPVLVARQSRISQILFAIDGSSGASHAEDLLRTWSIFDDLAIRVVTVKSASPTRGEGIEREAHGVDASAGDPPGDPATHPEFAQHAAARLTAAGRDAEGVQRVGEPAAAIIRAAEQWNAESRRPRFKRTIGPRSAASQERGETRSPRIPHLGLDCTLTDRVEFRKRVVALSRQPG